MAGAAGRRSSTPSVHRRRSRPLGSAPRSNDRSPSGSTVLTMTRRPSRTPRSRWAPERPSWPSTAVRSTTRSSGRCCARSPLSSAPSSCRHGHSPGRTDALCGGRPRHLPPVALRVDEHGVERRRLAHPRLARDEHHPADALGGAATQLRDPAQRPVPPVQPRPAFDHGRRIWPPEPSRGSRLRRRSHVLGPPWPPPMPPCALHSDGQRDVDRRTLHSQVIQRLGAGGFQPEEPAGSRIVSRLHTGHAIAIASAVPLLVRRRRAALRVARRSRRRHTPVRRPSRKARRRPIASCHKARPRWAPQSWPGRTKTSSRATVLEQCMSAGHAVGPAETQYRAAWPSR